MSPLSEIISETIENNEKSENNRKSFSFNSFEDFLFLIDRKHQNTTSVQI